ncbi:MAG: SurA N-terminal domain-containing protein [Deltaproteobacteria bacterium]|nr:SurA N-terminal domain-containing protein [Deltaproteobacteria bacterium]
MLDHLRNHAASWLTKTLLGLMSIGLIFFFGSSGLRRAEGIKNSPNILAEVNGEKITQGLFEMNYENQMRFYEQIFKGNISEEMKEKAKQDTLDQLLRIKLFAQEAKKMGVRVSKSELIEAITQNPNFSKDNVFDKNFYLKQVKPGFFKQTQVDYEDYLNEILLAEKFEDLNRDSVKVSDEEVKEEYSLNKTELNLEKYSVDLNKIQSQAGTESNPEKAKEQKTKEIEQEVFSTLSESQPSNPKDKKKTPSAIEVLKKKYELKDESTGFYSLRERAALVGSTEIKDTKEPLQCIVQLTLENPWCRKAYPIENQLVFFKLVGRKDADMEKFDQEKSKLAGDLLNRKKNLVLKQIADKLLQKAKTTTNSNLM